MPFKFYLVLLITGMMQLTAFAQQADSSSFNDPDEGRPVLEYAGGKKVM